MVSQRDMLLYGALALGALYLYSKKGAQPSSGSPVDFTTDPVSSVSDTIVSAVAGWKNVGSGPQWVPVLNEAESIHGIPADLLARVAYQESRFREDIIRGSTTSAAGALGIMQMMPQYFISVRAPRPFSDADVIAQIDEAAGQMVSLFNSTGAWPLALAGYNAGLGNVQKYGGIPPFKETQNYVAQIIADVPVSA